MLSLIAAPSKADFFELQDVYVEYKSFFPGGVDPLITQNGLGHNLSKELNLHFNIDIFKYFYWNNMVHSMTDVDNNGSGQFRLIGYNFKLGFYLSDYVELGYGHFSKHLLDYAGLPGWHFPVQDCFYFQIHFFRRRNPGKGFIPF